MQPTHVPAIRNAAGYLAGRVISSAVSRMAARAVGAVAGSHLSTASSTGRRARRQQGWPGHVSCAAAGLSTSATLDKGTKSWSDTMTFSSPESDFTAQADVAMAARAFPSTQQRQDAHPREDFIDHIQSDDRLRTDMAYSLSFAGSETDWSSPHVVGLLDERQRRQLAHAEEDATLSEEKLLQDEVVEYDTRRELLDAERRPRRQRASATEVDAAEPSFHFQDIYAKIDSRPLPKNLAEATSPTEDRPIVVTETKVPFRVVAVNAPWEGLCGYTQSEARGRTLGDMLQGPETDTPAVTALIDKLLHGEEAGTVLTNYAKDGRKFQNRLRVGELRNDKGDRVTHFVGVLREIAESPDRFEGSEGEKLNA